MKEAAVKNFHSPPYALAKQRIEFFKRWNKRALELTAAEQAAEQLTKVSCRDILLKFWVAKETPSV